ncbi:MAG: 2Fe-2S iron-sulfur cluster-binding protein [Gammaproteobacteria bacterium]|nr:2Fe-2S iron-sulfur cluster-binding protein [Gammaproteobacteria bacterium]
MASRLPPQPGEWIDRGTSINFSFEGKGYRAFKGDVITSALLAADRLSIGRSFKYHRLRGVLSAANHDANLLVETTTRTNIRADIEHPEPGVSYRAVNTFGGLKRDAGSLLQLFSSVLPVGFYYKTFYRPRALFPIWEKLLRRFAGLGAVNTDAPIRRWSRRNRFCDVLVIGGGAAGLAAARTLAGRSLEVIVVDENPRLGGRLHYQGQGDPTALSVIAAAEESFGRDSGIEVLTAHFAAGFYADNSVPLVGPDGIIQVQAKCVIFATGLYEQPAVFRNNDLPGIMLASGVQRLVHRYAIAPFDSAVVLAGNREAYRVTLDLVQAGLNITTIVDMGDGSHGELRERVNGHGITVIPQATVISARARGGRLAAIRLRTETGKPEITCDGLLMSVGWAPAAGLAYQAGATMEFDETIGQLVPRELPSGLFVAGSLNGVFDDDALRADGEAAASDALKCLGLVSPDNLRPRRSIERHSHPYPIAAHSRGWDFVDFDEDVQVGDLRTAWREGFDSAELMKRYATVGMGPSQGKTANMNAQRILARLNETSVQAAGVTTSRPFTHPVPMGMLAGRRFRPRWRTPMHACHVARQADLMEAGTWLRPRSYTRKTPESAITDEYARVRHGVGIIDVSTLGKIELFGADALPLLEYAYTCSFTKLGTGMTRYIFMVDDTGTLVDDGVAARVSDDHFYVTATSSHAQAAVLKLQLYAVQLGLDVAVIDRTFRVGAINLAGPLSAQVLASLTGLDLSAQAFPYLGIRFCQLDGTPVRLLRVGFVGELGYEIHFPASYGPALWRALLNAGAAHDIRPFGVDAQRLLRLEKGHLIVGQDTDGTTNPYEAGLGWGVNLSKSRFVGRHSLKVLKTQTARKLVGFTCSEPEGRMIEECHLVIEGGVIAGRVTSVAYSPYCSEVIGLMMVDLALTRTGRELKVKLTDGGLAAVRVAKTPFYDPDNQRQHLHAQQTVNTAK